MPGDVKNGPIDRSGSTNIGVKKRGLRNDTDGQGSTTISVSRRRLLGGKGTQLGRDFSQRDRGNVEGRMTIDPRNCKSDEKSMERNMRCVSKWIVGDTRDAEDRITNLPRDLIDHILKCLPVHDVAKTSTLSKAWMYIWTMHPQLVLDLDFYLKLVSNKEENTHEAQYLRAIELILLARTGPVLYLILYVPPLLDRYALNLLIKRLLNKGVTTLELANSEQCACLIPSNLFDCAQQLTRLKLTTWILNSPHKSGNFTNLVSVHLFDVSITAEMSFGPQLMELYLVTCTGVEHLRCQFTNVNNLKTLVYVESDKLDWRWLECTKGLEVCAIAFPCISSNINEPVNLIKCLCHVPSICYLFVNGFSLEFSGPSRSNLERLTTKMVNMKSLRLHNLRYDLCQISNGFCLIRNLPNLQILSIVLELDMTCMNPAELTIERYLGSLEDMVLNHLLTLEIHGVVGSRFVLLLIKLLLQSSPSLEGVSIFCSSEVSDASEKLKIKQQLQRLPRLSLAAKLFWC